LPEGVTGDRKFGMSLNMFADIAWNEGNSRKIDVPFAMEAKPPISFVISVRPSVRSSTFINEHSTGGLYVKFDIGDIF
jgi:hypothetical protein